MAWYKTGTVAVTNGSKVVTGTGTLWSLNVKPGDAFSVDGSKWYEIASLDAATPDTKLTLVENYTGTTASGQAYKVQPLSFVSLSTAALASQVSALLNGWQGREDEFRNWQAGSATGGYDINGNAASGATAGYYPLTDAIGVKRYIACPAKLATLDAGSVDGFHASQSPVAGQIPALTANNALVIGGGADNGAGVDKIVLRNGGIFMVNDDSVNAPYKTKAGIAVLNSYTGAFGYGCGLKFGVGATLTDFGQLGALVAVYDGYSATNGLGGRLAFYTKYSATDTAPVERMRISANGNVVIGSTSDNGSDRLQVAGNIVASQSSNYSAISVKRTDQSSAGQTDQSVIDVMTGTGAARLVQLQGGVTKNALALYPNGTTYIGAYGTTYFGQSGSYGLRIDLPTTSQTQINATATAAGAVFDINHIPSSGTEAAQIRMFRATNTTGAVEFQIMAGNNTSTINHKLSGNGDSALAMNTGNVLVGISTPVANGGVLQLKSGITFPATQVASSNANTLDDYEEGTWTPALAGETTAGSATYSMQTGTYTKIGRLVRINCRLQWSGHTGTGNFRIHGLPFGCVTASALSVWASNVLIGAGKQFTAYASSGLSIITLAAIDPAGGAVANIQVDTAGDIFITGTYEV